MKKLLLTLGVAGALLSCKEEVKQETPEVPQEQTAVETSATEEKKDYKVKSVTRKDYFAENNFGDYVQGKQINRVVQRFNEESIPYEIEIEIIDPTRAKSAGDTLAKNEDKGNVFTYTPKKN
ncbi:MAG: hypothetical protein HRT68_05005, partial [Flavobacteriaceae bacterium]|nr:hypothetical protein [Flavobacteriaceae bacterium]